MGVESQCDADGEVNILVPDRPQPDLAHTFANGNQLKPIFLSSIAFHPKILDVAVNKHTNTILYKSV